MDLDVQYESVQSLCFNCCFIWHMKRDYPEKEMGEKVANFGKWVRTSPKKDAKIITIISPAFQR